jgi:Zn-dependent protease with chaperone function
MPEVAIFDGEPNAFATGAFKNSALVAVSTGLLHSMNREEVEAVIGHEVAHVANGDMVTMTLIQGVMNTFVVFLSRVIGYFVDKVLLRNDRDGVGIGFMITTIVLDIVLGVLASIIVAWFSRQREFRADAGCRRADGPQAADDQCAGAPGRHGPRPVAAERRDDGHQRTPERADGAVQQPPADRGPHPRAAAGLARMFHERCTGWVGGADWMCGLAI